MSGDLEEIDPRLAGGRKTVGGVSAAVCEAERKGIPEKRRAKARALWAKSVKQVVLRSRFVSALDSRRETYLFVNEDGDVFWLIKLLFALPQFSLIPLTLLINVHIIQFYNERGVSLAFISFFQIFARSFDVLTDPLMAHISDNLTHTRYGRRLPYMMLCPLYAVAFFILVSPPDGSLTATLWFGGSYVVFYLTDTLVNVPFQALGPELTDDAVQRTGLYMWVKIAEAVGIVVGVGLPAILIEMTGDKRLSFQIIAIIFGSWYILAMYALIKNVKERPASLIDTEVRQPFVTSIFRSLRNGAFRPLVFGWICDFATLALLTTLLPFFIIYYVEADEPDRVLSVAMGCLFVSSSVCIPIWKYVSSEHRNSNAWYEYLKIGRVNAWLTYNVVNCVSNFMFVFIGQGDVAYLYICMVFNGMPFGGQFLIPAMLSDVIDYDEFLNYNRSEGQFSVFAQFIPKLIAIPCQSFPLVILFLLGFRDPVEVKNPRDSSDTEFDYKEQNENVKWFIRIIVVFVPLILVSVSFLIKRRFPIKTLATMQQIADGITKHLQGKPAVDPITGEEVWIEQMSDDELYLAYLLDHFQHEQILWLLSPDVIYKRHKETGAVPRKATLRHINLTGDEDREVSEDENVGYVEEEDLEDHVSLEQVRHRRRGCCGCFNPSGADVYSVTTRQEMQFGKDEQGEVVYVCVADLEAHGIKRGTERLQRIMLAWVIGMAVVCVVCIACVGATAPLLTNKKFAIIPAVFCLGTGLSLTAVGFSYLRYKAAGEIYEFVKEKEITEEQLAKIIYPKAKGQNGGDHVTHEEMLHIEAFVPRPTAAVVQMRSLANMDHLLRQKSAGGDDDDLYG